MGENLDEFEEIDADGLDEDSPSGVHILVENSHYLRLGNLTIVAKSSSEIRDILARLHEVCTLDDVIRGGSGEVDVDDEEE